MTTSAAATPAPAPAPTPEPTRQPTPPPGRAAGPATDPHDHPGAAPRRRAWRVVLGEIAHAALVLPVVIAGVLLVPAFHLLVPALAEGERALVRLAVGPAPSGRHGGTRWWPWLTGRIGRTAFWRQDLPAVLGGLVLAIADFFIGFPGTLAGVILLVSPVIASTARPVELSIRSWHVVATSPAQAWWFAVLGVLALAVVWLLLLGLGRLRGLLVGALSRDDDAERLAALTAEVGHLTSGRATLVDAFDAERARLERDLHDGAQRELVALALDLGVARLHAGALDPAGTTGPDGTGGPDEAAGRPRPDDPGGAEGPHGPDGPRDSAAATDAGSPGSPGRAALLADLDRAQDRAEAALRALRETVHGIRPAILTERGLAPALDDLAGRAPLPTTVAVRGTASSLAAITSPVATTVYFAVSEALTNAAKHAGPGATATVVLEVAEDRLTAVVLDDGAGGARAAAGGGTGLAGMAQRVESVGGHLDVASEPGAGTRVAVTAPLTPPWAHG